jgi:hypothetical protein
MAQDSAVYTQYPEFTIESGQSVVHGPRTPHISSGFGHAWQTSREKATNPSERLLDSALRHGRADSYDGGVQNSVPVVATTETVGRRCFHSSIQAIGQHLHECFQHGLGRPHRGHTSIRTVDPGGTSSTYQQLGDVGGHQSGVTGSREFAGQTGSPIDRQLYSGELHQPPGWDPLSISVHSDRETSPVHEQVRCNIGGKSHSRVSERSRRRSLESRGDHLYGVDSSSGSFSSHIFPVGYSASGSVCNPVQQLDSSVRVSFPDERAMACSVSGLKL